MAICDPAYTHFAILKPANKIVFGWDYSDVEPSELAQDKKYYFMGDMVDNGFSPKDIKILNRRSCERQGIDPCDDENWCNGYSDCGMEWPENEAYVRESIIREAIGGERYLIRCIIDDLGAADFPVHSAQEAVRILQSQLGEDYLKRIKYIEVCDNRKDNLSEPDSLIAFAGQGGYWDNNGSAEKKRKPSVAAVLGVQEPFSECVKKAVSETVKKCLVNNKGKSLQEMKTNLYNQIVESIMTL